MVKSPEEGGEHVQPSVVHMTLKTEPRGGSPIECFDVKIDNCKILSI